MTLRPLLSLSLLACACGPTKPDPSSDDSTSAAATSSSSSSGPTTPEPTSAGDTPAGDTSAGPTSAPDPSSTTDSPPNTSLDTSEPPTTTFVTTVTTRDDTTGEPVPCDLSLQDCPEGQKCSVVAMSPEDLFQGMFVCVPLDPDPVPPHAACDVFGDPADGTDNCEAGAICLDPDPSGIGECFAFCDFSQEQLCLPGDFCVGATCQTCTWSFCDSPCDALDPATCDADETCIPSGDTWTCILDASGDDGQQGDACPFVNTCDPGLVCVDGPAVLGCATDGCCTTACDTTAPNTCPGKGDGVTCKPWYQDGQAPTPALAELGVCTK